MKRFFAIGSVLALSLSMIGCPKSVPQTELQKAATASEQAVGVLKTFQQSEILMYQEGKTCVTTTTCVQITDEDHLFIQQSLQTVFRTDKTVNTCIGAATTGSVVTACVNNALATIDQLQTDGALHIKSAQAKQDFSIALAGARGALTVISTILGGS